jgi:hypothetical protein
VHAEESELAESKAKAKGGEDRHGKDEDESLEESRHIHHREDPSGNGALTLIDVMIAKLGSDTGIRDQGLGNRGNKTRVPGVGLRSGGDGFPGSFGAAMGARACRLAHCLLRS